MTVGKYLIAFLMSTSAFANGYSLAWQSPDQPDSYRVYMSETPGAMAHPSQIFEMGNGTQVLLPEMTPGQILFVQVTSFKVGLESPPSNECSFVIPFVSISPITGGVRFWYYQAPEVTGNLKFTLQISKDLKDWSLPIPITPVITAQENGSETVSIDLPKTFGDPVFGRIKVEASP